jgi:hypothetical protein
MARFEELQMMLVESATKYLDLYSMQVFTEQFTLDRESKIFLTLQDMEPPYLISTSVSYTFDAFQTGLSLFREENDDDSDIDSTVDLDFNIKLPALRNYPDITSLYESVADMLEDTDAGLTTREYLDTEGSFKEYEITYSYEIDQGEDLDPELFDEIFSELKEVMDYIYHKTEAYIDMSWYGPEQ